MKRLLFALLLSLSLLSVGLSPAAGKPISRQEVITRAQTFCFHPWTCKSQNLTASCAAGYKSVYVPGDYLGLPYDWGGYMTLFQFDDGIKNGLGAGSYSDDGVLSCTVGMDCSGFVSKVWDVGHFGTSTISGTSSQIGASDVKPGDAFNVPGYHVILYGGTISGNWPVFYEAIGYNTIYNTFAGWANVSGFTPIRRDGIVDGTVGNPTGTAVNPIKVTSFPYVHNGDTTNSPSDLFDYYGADTSKKETGPEVIYQVEITQPGKLTISVQDGPGVDIDVHLCEALESYHCIARNDTFIEKTITACGTWYVVADSWSNSSGVEYPGAYTLTLEHQPTGGGCGAWNEPFDLEGEIGAPCGYPAEPGLPFCNPNLGAEICLYSDQPGNTFSFCSFGCAGDGDCDEAFPDGCCVDVGGAGEPQDFFCVPEAFCGPTPPPPVDEGTEGPDIVSVPDSTVTPPADVVTPQDLPPVAPDAGMEEDVVSLLPDGKVLPAPDLAGAGETAGAEEVAGGVDGEEDDPDGEGGEEETTGKNGGGGCSAGPGTAGSSLALALLLVTLLGALRRRRPA